LFQSRSTHDDPLANVVITQKNVRSLKVGAVAKAAGVGVQTLHYYERLGLLPKPKRSAANYRLYPSEAIRRVRFIKKGQALGLTLDETKEILNLKERGRAPCCKVAELGEKHLREIEARLEQLREYRRLLTHALGQWRGENTTTRRCAGEFCDLIERLPDSHRFFKKGVDPLGN
jgi:DNA-binding transcriptional MerR regulator